jgi:hypothetical protein
VTPQRLVGLEIDGDGLYSHALIMHLLHHGVKPLRTPSIFLQPNRREPSGVVDDLIAERRREAARE